MEGRLQIRTFDGKDGNRHYYTEVIADHVEFIERKGSGTPAAAAPEQGAMESFGTTVGFDEEVPF